jgi:DNA ligase-associated metallophosphoesterase
VTKTTVNVALAGHRFTLLPEKAAIWESKKTLLIADVHAGKASHFRNNGIPLSTDHLLSDLNRIAGILETYDLQKISFLGDLYHTSLNIENTLIDEWLNSLDIEVELIIGNHDRHSLKHSTLTKKESYEIDGILLSHEPEKSDYFNICGHLHPAYNLSGKARQQIKLPAFYHAETSLILPAFGSVNGGRMYKELIKKAKVILVGDDGLIQV